VLAGACTWRAVGNRAPYLLLEEGLSGTRRSRSWPTEVGLTVTRSYVSATDQVALEARNLLQSRINSRLKRSLVGQPGTLPFEASRPEAGPTLLQWFTRRHTDQGCVFDAPGGAPHQISLMALLMTVQERMPIDATLPRVKPGESLLKGAPASEEAGCSPCRRSGKPAEGGWLASEPGCVRLDLQSRSPLPA